MKKVSVSIFISILILVGFFIKVNLEDKPSDTSSSNVNMTITKKGTSQNVKAEKKPKEIIGSKIKQLDDSRQQGIFKVEPEIVKQLQQKSVKEFNDKILDYNDYLHDHEERKNIKKGLEVHKKEFKSTSLYLAKKALENESKNKKN